MVVIAAGRKERCLLAVHHGDLEPQQIVIKSEGALQVGHLEVDVTDTYLWRNGIVAHIIVVLFFI
jgi:hypothetical protein